MHVRNGFNNRADDVFLFRACEQKAETGGEAIHVGNRCEEIKGAINRLEAERSDCSG